MQSQMCRFERPLLDTHDIWTRIGHVNVVKNWSAELRSALGAGASADWELIGRGIFIQHDSADDSYELVQKVATEIGLASARVDLSSVKDPRNEPIIADAQNAQLAYLEPGDWMHLARGSSADDLNHRALQGAIRELLQKFNPLNPVILITSGDDYSDLTPALRQAGQFDRCLEIVPFTVHERGLHFLSLLGSGLCSEDLFGNAARLGQLLECETEGSADFASIAIALKRIAYRESRPLEFIDVVRACLHGTAERDVRKTFSPENLYRTAVHEAGHAAVAIVNSDGKDVPDYAAIGMSGDFGGIVAPSYALLVDKDFDIATIQHYIRVLLGGRAAEHVILGWDRISVGGAHSDLRRARRWAQGLFAHGGVSLHADDDARAGDNLCITGRVPTDSERSHVDALVRQYLHQQYNIVLALLRNNRHLLDAITESLVERTVMSGPDMNDIILDIALYGGTDGANLVSESFVLGTAQSRRPQQALGEFG